MDSQIMTSTALQNDLILREIMSHLRDLSGQPIRVLRDKKAISTLAGCARVCKEFEVHALNALWWHMDTLMPLLQLLGSSLIATPAAEGSTLTVKTLLLPIREHEWLRLLSYARRIRRLLVIDVDFEHVDPTVWMTLAAHSGGTPLLSNLAHLQWVHSIKSATLNVIYITPPAIRTLDAIYIPPRGMHQDQSLVTRSEVVFQNMVHILASRATKIRELVFRVSHTCILESIDRFHSVHRLLIDAAKAGPLSRTFIEKIGSLPQLRVLLLDLPVRTIAHSTPAGFPALRDVTLKGSPGSIDHLLSAMLGTHLTMVDLIFKDIDESELSYISNLLYKLRDCGNSSIEFISLKAIPRDFPKTMYEFKDVLKPLLALRRILRADIELHFKMAMNVQDVHDMAVAWPSLIKLNLFYVEDGQPLPPISCLSTFAKHCLNLRTLELPGLQDCETDLATLAGSPHPLSRIFMAKQFVPSEKLARFLFALFPRLETNVAPSHGPQWRETLETLAALQAGARNGSNGEDGET
ncbi:uncharacterized protein C8Q71DRAFT_862213 [Rhodofomes roseus]|uniref:F-box domain-containing protein n=1 Tax=Rhodofomes roseus TaxID=34475 RepID=A0ABQ8K332_9APHY|nr:uncharacterized protein C8Q71DRAFT_862213 [Rhodofomes roseus]KAH9830760.1 hypothetical protein C8Q71DRAFT_862213 [Rhodofomes roseus]